MRDGVVEFQEPEEFWIILTLAPSAKNCKSLVTRDLQAFDS